MIQRYSVYVLLLAVAAALMYQVVLLLERKMIKNKV